MNADQIREYDARRKRYRPPTMQIDVDAALRATDERLGTVEVDENPPPRHVVVVQRRSWEVGQFLPFRNFCQRMRVVVNFVRRGRRKHPRITNRHCHLRDAADRDADRNAYRDGDVDAQQHADRDADVDANSNIHSHTDIYTNNDMDADRDANAQRYADFNMYAALERCIAQRAN